MSLSMYRTFCDESGRDGVSPVFVVGGLTATVAQWTALSDRWQAVLDEPPSIPHFHYADWQSLSEAEHQQKIDSLIPIINEFVERGDLIVIDIAAYQSVMQGKYSVTWDRPFHMGYVAIFQQAAARNDKRDAKIDFVFDDIDLTQLVELREAYGKFRAICPIEDVKRRFGGLPTTGNDEEIVALQAADLWVGTMRNALARDVQATRDLYRLTIKNQCTHMDREMIAAYWQMISAGLAAKNLTLEYENKTARKKRLKLAKKLLRAGV